MVDSDFNIEVQQGFLMKMQGDDPPYLSVGTAVSAKYKGAFCEAKVSKVVRVVKCKVTYKLGLGNATLSDEQIKGTLRVGQLVQAKHMERKEYVDATITKIQDCSQYTVVFDDGDITTLRRTALCLKSGRHFNESETLDQLPLTHPEHFGNPVVSSSGRRGRRSRQAKEESSDGEVEEENEPDLEGYILEVGRVVCVEASEKKRGKDNWFPGLVVMPSAQPTVRINMKDEFLVRSFKDGRYYTVPQTEVTEFNHETAAKVEGTSLADAVEKVTRYLSHDEFPTHWERSLLFHSSMQILSSDSDENFTDSSDDETSEEKDHFVAQLYKFMDDSNTPLNKSPMIGSKDVDLHKLFQVVRKLGGYNRVTNKNKWRRVTVRLKFPNNINTHNQVKSVYKKFLFSFEAFHRTLGVTMLNHSRTTKKSKGRSLIRDKDRNTPVNSPRPEKEDEMQILEKKEEEKLEEKLKSEEKIKVEEKPKLEEKHKLEDKSKVTVKKQEVKLKSEDEKKPKEIVEISDTNSSDIPDHLEHCEPTVVMVRLRRADSKVTPEKKPKVATVSVEKVKTPVEKVEEPIKVKDKEKDKGQQTRSKTQTPKAKEKEITKEAVTDKKVRESKTPVPDVPSPSKTPTRHNKKLEDDKKKGKKRSIIDEKEKTSFSDSSATDSSITHSLVGIGDKLKVYYGPNHESKVTYEAKVIEIDKESVHPMYLVHYTGWNTRYDEWITQSRIAENLSATTKAKKLKQGNSGSKAIQQRASKRGRRISTTGRTTSQDTIRSTTPSKSPSIINAPRSHRATRQDSSRRTRRISAQTDASNHSSDSDNSESDTDIIKSSSISKLEDTESRPIRKKLLKAIVKLEKKEKEEEESEKEEEPQTRDQTKRVKKLRKTLEAKSDTDDQSEESDDGDNGRLPKGRDFDLNQIRSELKGLVKPIKAVNDDVGEKEAGSSDESSTLTEPKAVSTSSDLEVEDPDKCDEKPTIKKSPSSEDIYEFKEPEPFEFETRSKIADDKCKKRLVSRIFEDLEKSPRKRKSESPPRDLKEFESDKKNLQITPIKKEEDDEDENDTNAKLALSDDPFDKLVESPSFHSGKEQIAAISLESKHKVTKTLDMDEPLTLFQGLPDGVDDESDEQLDISDTEMTNEPLFSHKEQLFSDAAFGGELSDAIFRGFITKNIEEKVQKDSDDEEEDQALRESVQNVINQTTLSEDDDSNNVLLLEEPFDHFPESEVNTKSENCVESSVDNLNSIESEDDDLKDSDVVEDIKIVSPSLCSVPEIVIPAVQNDPIPLKKPKVVDSLLLKLGIIKNEDSDEEVIENFSNPISEPKVDDSFVPQVKEGKIKTIEPRVRPPEIPPKIIEAKCSKLKTLEPKLKTLEPKLKAAETKIKTLEPKIKTLEPKIKTLEPKLKTIEPKIKTDATDLKKRGKKFVSREFIDESDSDSTDSEERLVIHSDDESHTNSSSDAKSSDPQCIESDENFKLDSKSPLHEKSDSKIETNSSDKEDETDSHLHSLLLCEETIPGSPAPPQEDSLIEIAQSLKGKAILEIPFASVPGTSSKGDVSKEKLVVKERIQPPPLIIPLDHDKEAHDVRTVLDNTPPTTPESTLSNLSPRGEPGGLSPNTLDNDSCKSGDGDADYSQQKRNSSHKLLSYSEEGSGDTLLQIESNSSSKKSQETPIGTVIRKRRRSYRGAEDIPSKRGRKPLNRSRHNSDSDDTSEHSISGVIPLGANTNIDNRMFRSPKASRYNFFVDLDPNLDGAQRIAILQQKLQDIRKTYAEVKAELATVERRKKKLRRRDREAKLAAKHEALAT